MTRRSWVTVLVGVLVVGPVVLCTGTGVVGLFLPGDVALEAEEVVAAPPEALFDLLDDADGIARWWANALPVSGGEPSMSVAPHPGAPTAGVGTVVDFEAGGMAMETWTIEALDPPRKVDYTVDFGLLKVHRTIQLVPEPAGTRIRWSESGYVGNPWLRCMNLMSDPADVVANLHGAMKALGSAAGA